MIKHRKFIACMLLGLFIGAPPIYATSVSSLDLKNNTVTAEEPNKSSKDDIKFSNSNSSSEGDHIDGEMFGTANKIINKMQAVSERTMEEENQDLLVSTTNFWQTIVSRIVQLFFGSLVGVYILHSAIDMFAMLSHFIRQLMGVQDSGSSRGSSSMGGMNDDRKHKISWVSDDYYKAMSLVGQGEGGSMSGMSGMSGGSDRSQVTSVFKNVFIAYGKLRVVGFVFAMVVGTFLLTPVGYDLMLAVAKLLISVIVWITHWFKGVSGDWINSMSSSSF